MTIGGKAYKKDQKKQANKRFGQSETISQGICQTGQSRAPDPGGRRTHCKDQKALQKRDHRNPHDVGIASLSVSFLTLLNRAGLELCAAEAQVMRKDTARKESQKPFERPAPGAPERHDL